MKHIHELSSSYDFNFYYFYDSTDGMLQKVMLDNKLFVTISKKNENYITIDYDVSVIYPSLTQKIKLKAYFDNGGFINKIVKIDTINSTEEEIIQFYLFNNYPDSIREYPSTIFRESKLYDFNFLSGNIVSLTRLSDNILTGFQIDTLSFYYNQTIVNKNILPVQNLYIGTYFVGFATATTQPLYLLALDGFFPFKNNKNALLDSIEFKGNNGGVSKYSYTVNLSGIISRTTYTGSLATFSYDFEYY